jgi:hypothetical protein
MRRAEAEIKMAKLIFSRKECALREITLVKDRTSIGRGNHNDIVIDDCVISNEHAVIVTVNNDSFLEDLNSTNGTQVNGQPVRKHFLQEGDVIELAGYQIRYLAIHDSGAINVDLHRFANYEQAVSSTKGIARIKILNGPHAGKEIKLFKPLTTIGWSEVQSAVITRHPHGYYLTYINGNTELSINGKSLRRDDLLIGNGDLIDLSGIQIQFLLCD